MNKKQINNKKWYFSKLQKHAKVSFTMNNDFSQTIESVDVKNSNNINKPSEKINVKIKMNDILNIQCTHRIS